ncbi:MAG TPA: hypothetical protein GXX51_05640 [Firmicutes bacterium]|nr:hypothetical protein [Bacillota bacterium]
MGRPTRLTPEMADKIANLISTGNYDVVVCGLVGIHPSTYYNWLSKGEKAKSGIYREFFDKVKKAEAAREAKWVKDIEGDPSWQSKAWLLERRYPDRWGRREVNVNMNQDVRVTTHHEYDVVHRVIMDPKARELARQLYERVALGRKDACQGGPCELLPEGDS